jgi:hypothetical protein
MMPFFYRTIMIKKKPVIIGIVATASAALALGLFLWPRLSEDQPSPESTYEMDVAANMGITYIRVTPELSAYYDLGVDSGVLVTEVIPDSPMDCASLQAGDVILSCNGTPLDEGAPLLGLVRRCGRGDNLVLEVYRDRCCRTIECCPYCGTENCDCYHQTNEDEN